MQSSGLEGPLETQHNPFISQMGEQTHVIKSEIPLDMLTCKDQDKIFVKCSKQVKGAKYSMSPFHKGKRQ